MNTNSSNSVSLSSVEQWMLKRRRWSNLVVAMSEQPLRRSARIAAKVNPEITQVVSEPAVVAVVSEPTVSMSVATANPVPTADSGTSTPSLRRSARLVAKPLIRYHEDGTISKDISPQVKKDIRIVLDYLQKIKEVDDSVEKADLTIKMYRFIYHNNLLMLQHPAIRSTIMDKLTEIVNNPNLNSIITTNQLRTFKELHETFSKFYKIT